MMRAWLESWPEWAQTSLEVVATVATAVAAILAAVTIRQAKKQAAAAQAALILERRIDFELGVVTDLAVEHAKGSNVAFVQGHIQALASLLPIDLVPLTRAVMDLGSTVSATKLARDRQQPGSTKRESLRVEVAKELEAAANTLLQRRPPSINEVSRRRRWGGKR